MEVFFPPDERDPDYSFHLEALNDCAMEGGVLIEEADLPDAAEQAEQSDMDISVVFQRAQYVCILFSIREPDEDE